MFYDRQVEILTYLLTYFAKPDLFEAKAKAKAKAMIFTELFSRSITVLEAPIPGNYFLSVSVVHFECITTTRLRSCCRMLHVRCDVSHLTADSSACVVTV